MKNAPEMQEITPEYVMQLGQELIDAVFQATPADEAMKHYTAEDRLAGLDLREHLADRIVVRTLVGSFCGPRWPRGAAGAHRALGARTGDLRRGLPQRLSRTRQRLRGRWGRRGTPDRLRGPGLA